jgi:hypothetical protein
MFKNGNQLMIDEKKRDKDWGDFLCEIWSVGEIVAGMYEGKKVGWTLDENKRCHYVAYAIVPAKTCHLLPFDLLRLTAKVNLQRWMSRKGAYPKDAVNKGYLTRNCAVPWDDLWRSIREQSRSEFGSLLELPKPIIGEQGLLVFEHGEGIS